MDRQIDRVRKAYDLTVELHKKGINPMDNIPEEIKNSPSYNYFLTGKSFLGSGALDIKEYLAPVDGMNFLDAGCSANIVNYHMDLWPSLYYGIDISPKLISAMQNYVNRQQITIGGLYVADVSNIPFDNDFFDIAAMIGVLEYCTLEYIRKALLELNRVLKPGSRVVLDIPNSSHLYAADMKKLEEYLERPNIFHSREIFEESLKKLFVIDRADDSQVMIKYFIRAIK